MSERGKPPKENKPPETPYEREQREKINSLADEALALAKANGMESAVSNAIWQTLDNYDDYYKTVRLKMFGLINNNLIKRGLIKNDKIVVDDDKMIGWPYSKKKYAEYMKDAQKKLDDLVEQIHGPLDQGDQEKRKEIERDY